MNRGSENFHEELAALGTLHDKKQQDYGTEADPFANVRAAEDFGVPAWLGCLVRMNDKMTRLKNFAKKGSLTNESVEDSLRDLAVYSLIALCLYREKDNAREGEREILGVEILKDEGGWTVRSPSVEGEVNTSEAKPPPAQGA